MYAQDNRDAKITLKVDTSKVNFKKKGTYTITYTAEDKAGNVNKKTAKIAVRVNDSLDQMADTVLGRIIKKTGRIRKKRLLFTIIQEVILLIPEIQTNQAGRKRLLTVCAMDGETVLLTTVCPEHCSRVPEFQISK